jgi:hypothetical protein
VTLFGFNEFDSSHLFAAGGDGWVYFINGMRFNFLVSKFDLHISLTRIWSGVAIQGPPPPSAVQRKWRVVDQQAATAPSGKACVVSLSCTSLVCS